MKNQWPHYSIREKQFILGGTFLILVFLIFALIYLPLQNKISTLHNEMLQNQKLLSWMQDVDQQLEKTQRKFQPLQNDALLSRIQLLLNRSSLMSKLGQMQQINSDTIELSFKEIEFTALMNWLSDIYNQQGVHVTKISIKASQNPGIIDANLSLIPS